MRKLKVEKNLRLSRAPTVVADSLAALVLFPVQTTYLLSYTALIYSGPLAFGRAAGLAGMLLTTVIAALVTAIGSSFKTAFGTLDNNAMAITATLVATIALDMAGADRATLMATVTCGMAIAGVVAGAFLLAIGYAGAGNVVRLIPPPVTAGFLGVTGWLLASGAARVAAGQSLSLSALADRAVDARLVAMAAVAAAFALLARRTKSPFAVPALIGTCILLHHAVFAALGLGLADQREAGWLIAFPGALGMTLPWSPDVFVRIDWTVLAHHSLGLVVLAVVAPISLLLTTTGLETAMRQEVDINRELRVGGLSSLLSGCAGGTIGFTAFARSLMLKVSGGQSRLAPILSAILIGIVPPAFPQILGLSRFHRLDQQIACVIPSSQRFAEPDHGGKITGERGRGATEGSGDVGAFARSWRGGSGASGLADACGLDEPAHRTGFWRA